MGSRYASLLAVSPHKRGGDMPINLEDEMHHDEQRAERHHPPLMTGRRRYARMDLSWGPTDRIRRSPRTRGCTLSPGSFVGSPNLVFLAARVTNFVVFAILARCAEGPSSGSARA